MKCTCPKCHGKIELVLPQVTEEGAPASCPACKAHFTVHMESFGGRALRKSGEISCASCGEELGPQIHCASCGKPFPDYLVAGLGRKKARGKITQFKLASSPFKKHYKPASQLPTLEAAMAQENVAASRRQDAVAKRYPKNLVLAASVIVALALIAAGAGLYSKWKAETSYMKNYARATYVIQVGTDMSRKTCLKIASDWKANLDAGKNITPRASKDDEKELQSVRAKLDLIKAKLSQEPEKFKSCNEKLAKFEGPYNNLQSLTVSPGNSLAGFTETLNKIDVEYKQAANQFKAGLPDELMKELQSASKKYRELRPLFK